MRHPSTPSGNNGNSQRTRGAIRTHLGRKRTGPRARTFGQSTLEGVQQVTESARHRQEELFDRLLARFHQVFEGGRVLVRRLRPGPRRRLRRAGFRRGIHGGERRAPAPVPAPRPAAARPSDDDLSHRRHHDRGHAHLRGLRMDRAHPAHHRASPPAPNAPRPRFASAAERALGCDPALSPPPRQRHHRRRLAHGVVAGSGDDPRARRPPRGPCHAARPAPPGASRASGAHALPVREPAPGVPQGQLVAESEGRVVGAGSSLIVQWNDYAVDHTWKGVTGDGHFDDPRSPGPHAVRQRRGGRRDAPGIRRGPCAAPGAPQAVRAPEPAAHRRRRPPARLPLRARNDVARALRPARDLGRRRRSDAALQAPRASTTAGSSRDSFPRTRSPAGMPRSSCG